MIISILDTAFQSAKDASFNYQSAPIWELNTFDDPSKPVVYWALPFTVVSTPTKVGNRVKVVANLLFLQISQITERQTTRTTTIDAMQDAMIAFIKRFSENSSIIPDIKSVRYEDVYNTLDPNMDGISCFLEFEFNSANC